MKKVIIVLFAACFASSALAKDISKPDLKSPPPQHSPAVKRARSEGDGVERHLVVNRSVEPTIENELSPSIGRMFILIATLNAHVKQLQNQLDNTENKLKECTDKNKTPEDNTTKK